jgi:dipeptidyl aminopeptidase/acylaminoacyl peptidase
MWQNASLITHQSDVTTYLYYCKQDETVPYQQSVKLYDQIKLANPKNILILFDNCGHSFDGAFSIQILTQTIELIKN